MTLGEPHRSAKTAVYKHLSLFLPMEIWSLTVILTLLPDGSVAPDPVMLPLLLLVLLVPGRAQAGLLGAGTGLGSCAAPPFR